MKNFKFIIIILCIVMGLCTSAFAKSKSRAQSPQNTVRGNTVVPQSTKGATIVPGVFRVTNVTFQTILMAGKNHLTAAVMFNKKIDASTVRQNVNIRMLRKNKQHFWLDASTQNNVVRIRPNFITWVCGKPLKDGVYVMHLRGTIKSADGVFLDCNGDGKGEGGYLPAYESKLYLSPMPPPLDLEEADPSRIKDLIGN